MLGSIAGETGCMPRNHRVAMTTSGTSSAPTMLSTAPFVHAGADRRYFLARRNSPHRSSTK